MTDPVRRRRVRRRMLTRTAAVLTVAAWIGAVVLAGGSFASPSAPPTPASTPAGPPADLGNAPKVDPAVLAAESAASARAKSGGVPVTVDSLTDQTSQIVANPDGTLT